MKTIVVEVAVGKEYLEVDALFEYKFYMKGKKNISFYLEISSNKFFKISLEYQISNTEPVLHG